MPENGREEGNSTEFLFCFKGMVIGDQEFVLFLSEWNQHIVYKLLGHFQCYNVLTIALAFHTDCAISFS